MIAVGDENKLTKYGHFTPFVVVFLHEIERLHPTDRRHLQDRISLVEGGRLDAYQLDTGTVIVRGPLPKSATGVALYARVSSVDQKNDLERQMERPKDYAAAHGYHVMRMVQAIGSGREFPPPQVLEAARLPRPLASSSWNTGTGARTSVSHI
jgi:Resolvase, N terminal domain